MSMIRAVVPARNTRWRRGRETIASLGDAASRAIHVRYMTATRGDRQQRRSRLDRIAVRTQKTTTTCFRRSSFVWPGEDQLARGGVECRPSDFSQIPFGRQDRFAGLAVGRVSPLGSRLRSRSSASKHRGLQGEVGPSVGVFQ